MDADREKWNNRFASRDSYLGQHPSLFLQQQIERIEGIISGVRALDVACGEGRNSLFLAERGFLVTALDISDVGLAKARQRSDAGALAIDFRRVDLEDYKLEGSYDLVLNFNFLLRPLIDQEIAVLNPGGILLFDTIRESPSLIQSHNPDYLLKQGELVRLFEKFDGDILHFEEIDLGEMPTARLMFRKRNVSL